MSRIVQCCMCYQVKVGEGSEETWKKAHDAAAVSRHSRLTFCPSCERQFRKRWDLVAEKSQRRKAS